MLLPVRKSERDTPAGKMACIGVSWSSAAHTPLVLGSAATVRYCVRSRLTRQETPIPKLVIAVAVSATTQLLRLCSFPSTRGNVSMKDASPCKRNVIEVQDVMDALMVDYDQAYFLTGNVTSSLYAEDCYFADPTISFTGRDTYERNLKLLVPFLEEQSLSLFSLVKEPGEDRSIRAVWQLRTHLKLPWRPFICVDGSTVYDLDEQLRIVRHVESWRISVFEALSQIFKKGDSSP